MLFLFDVLAVWHDGDMNVMIANPIIRVNGLVCLANLDIPWNPPFQSSYIQYLKTLGGLAVNLMEAF